MMDPGLSFVFLNKGTSGGSALLRGHPGVPGQVSSARGSCQPQPKVKAPAALASGLLLGPFLLLPSVSLRLLRRRRRASNRRSRAEAKILAAASSSDSIQQQQPPQQPQQQQEQQPPPVSEGEKHHPPGPPPPPG
eukprot:CAMPEP_0115071982 /NCGR_PEP_ID=MMETSP0227-20121206/13977_1 /TAXON_ID=89957 /ORGANISM="Polarella glacialis, Strain CCMP 1383" /LENGTH=134 /DNA_ID=CAMNT_0002458679 /DNA_START=1 /DNA_END=402 /DNA_ORIENTATION=+